MSQKRYIDIFVSLGQCFFLLHVNILLILFNFFLSVSRSDSVFTLISHNHTESSHSHGVKCVCSGGGGGDGGVVSVGGGWGRAVGRLVLVVFLAQLPICLVGKAFTETGFYRNPLSLHLYD